mmetsp:Transcript_12848/g.49210  ORF Transcript_12848/g.49210 Transcript_12848/m.49210 type:complete len:449 (-) Transcript_12848:49-1395(-)
MAKIGGWSDASAQRAGAAITSHLPPPAKSMVSLLNQRGGRPPPLSATRMEAWRNCTCRATPAGSSASTAAVSAETPGSQRSGDGPVVRALTGSTRCSGSCATSGLSISATSDSSSGAATNRSMAGWSARAACSACFRRATRSSDAATTPSSKNASPSTVPVVRRGALPCCRSPSRIVVTSVHCHAAPMRRIVELSSSDRTPGTPTPRSTTGVVRCTTQPPEARLPWACQACSGKAFRADAEASASSAAWRQRGCWCGMCSASQTWRCSSHRAPNGRRCAASPVAVVSASICSSPGASPAGAALRPSCGCVTAASSSAKPAAAVKPLPLAMSAAVRLCASRAAMSTPRTAAITVAAAENPESAAMPSTVCPRIPDWFKCALQLAFPSKRMHPDRTLRRTPACLVLRAAASSFICRSTTLPSEVVPCRVSVHSIAASWFLGRAAPSTCAP